MFLLLGLFIMSINKRVIGIGGRCRLGRMRNGGIFRPVFSPRKDRLLIASRGCMKLSLLGVRANSVISVAGRRNTKFGPMFDKSKRAVLCRRAVSGRGHRCQALVGFSLDAGGTVHLDRVAHSRGSLGGVRDALMRGRGESFNNVSIVARSLGVILCRGNGGGRLVPMKAMPNCV